MEKKINNILFLTTKDGERLTFKVLFTYHSERFDKDYAVFYNEADENHLLARARGKITFYALSYNANEVIEVFEVRRRRETNIHSLVKGDIFPTKNIEPVACLTRK